MIKLSQLIKAWDILHVRDVGDIGFCDLDKALTESGVEIENDINPCQPAYVPKHGGMCPI